MTAELITNANFYLLAVPAVLLTGIAKMGFPGSFGGIAVPMMALAVSPIQAASVMLPLLCAMDLFGMSAFRGSIDKRNMRILIAGAVFGIAAGTLSFEMISKGALLMLTGVIAVVFSLNKVMRAAAQLEPTQASWGRGMFWSAISGFTSFIAHAGSPPLMVYLLPQQLPKKIFVGTSVVFFFAVNCMKILPYAWLGQLPLGNLLTSLVLLPLVPVGVWLGVWLQGKVPEALFYRVAVWLMLGVGLRLIYDGARQLQLGPFMP